METLVTVRAKYRPQPKAPWVEGVLTITNSTGKWIPNAPAQAIALELNLASIASHQKSAATSKLILLKLSNSPDPKAPGGYIFQFDAIADRDRASDAVGRILAQRSKANGTPPPAAPPPSATTAPLEGVNPEVLRKRMNVLQADAELAKLHAELVGTGVLTDNEFWSTRKDLLEKEEAKKPKQRTGLPSAMLADVRGTTDGKSNTVFFNLTPEIIHQIFTEKPAVLKAYLAYVPERMSERDFWTKYCRAEYMHRTRNAALHDDEDAAIFIEEDEQAHQGARRKLRRVDPSVDVAADLADDYTRSGGGGILRDGGKEPEQVVEEGVTKTRTVAHDLNRHAAVVLEGRPAAEDLESAAAAARAVLATNAAEEVRARQEETVDPKEERRRQEKVQEAVDIPDLQLPREPGYVPLRISDPRKYFDGAAAAEEGSRAKASPGLAHAQAVQTLRRQLAGLDPLHLPEPVIKADLALQILKEVSEQMRTATHSVGKVAERDFLNSIPKQLQEDVLQSSAKVNELLKHFWTSYPITTQALASKVERLKNAMSDIYDRLQKTKDGLPAEHRQVVTQMLRPLWQALDAAFVKYDTEAAQRAAKAQKRAEAAANGVKRPSSAVPTPG